MRRALFALPILSLLMVAAGCHTPTIHEPVGTPWTKSETAPLEGQWAVAEDENVIAAKSTQAGEITLGVLAWNDADKKYDLDNVKINLTHIGKHSFVFIPAEGLGDDAPGYLFAQLVHADGKKVSLALPNEAFFLKLVQSGRVAGRIDQAESRTKRSAHLLCDEAEFLKMIEEYGIEKCFDAEPNALLEFSILRRTK